MENQLGRDKIFTLIMKYSFPAIMGMIINSIYNMVDRIFIGNYVGEDALGGLIAAFPVMMLVFAFATLIGTGGSALISIKFGEKQPEEANKIFGNMIILTLVITAVTMIFGLSFIEPILSFTGAKGGVLVEATDYLSIIIYGALFQLLSFIFGALLRSVGKPKRAMASMMIAAITNIVFDYIFIVLCGFGSKGAAFATILGQAVGSVIAVSYFLTKDSPLKISLYNLKPRLSYMKNITMVGSANFMNTIGVSISSACLNASLEIYGGNSALTAMGAINSIYTLFIMPINGLQQGLQPIIGYNYGANLIHRSKEALYKGLIIAITFSTSVWLILTIFPQVVISMFISPESETMAVAITGLKYHIMAMPILPSIVVTSAFLQSTGKAKKALFLGSTRQFLFLIPMILILPSLFGITGVWLATPVADTMSITLSVCILYNTLKSY